MYTEYEGVSSFLSDETDLAPISNHNIFFSPPSHSYFPISTLHECDRRPVRVSFASTSNSS